MSEAFSHRAFFGDREHVFTLDAQMIAELARITATGIGKLARQLFAGEFRLFELGEVIRLGLIGAGAKPEEAAALVGAYTRENAIADHYELAVAIVSSAWFGASKIDPEHEEEDAHA